MPNSIEHQAKVSLDNSIEQLDSNIEQQLAAIRQQALHQPTNSERSSWLPRNSLVTAFSLAAVALLISSYLFNIERSEHSLPLVVQYQQPELHEDPELIAQLEFVYWLAEAHEQALL